MAVFYDKQVRVNPRTGGRSYYPIVKRLGLVGSRELARLVADETTMNAMEVEMALVQVEKVLVRLLLAGRSVKLGDWGSVSLTVGAEPSPTAQSCGPKCITEVRPQMRFSETFKEKLQHAHFQSIDTLKKRHRDHHGQTDGTSVDDAEDDQ